MHRRLYCSRNGKGQLLAQDLHGLAHGRLRDTTRKVINFEARRDVLEYLTQPSPSGVGFCPRWGHV
eukprot:11227086-Lingulodinium_polyedra.AAC.1